MIDNVFEVEEATNPPVDFVRQRYFGFDTKPLKIQGAMSNWKALTEWTHEWFKQRYGSLRVSLNTSIPGRKTMLMRDYIDLISADDAEAIRSDAGPLLYMDAAALTKFDGIEKFIDIPAYCPIESSIETLLWLGPKGTLLNLHRDNWHTFSCNNNLLAQIVGMKLVLLVSPDQAELVHAEAFTGKSYQHCPVDLEKPDYRKYPSLRKVTALRTVLRPGEMLLIPKNWFHHVRSLSASISISYWWVPRILELMRSVVQVDLSTLARRHAGIVSLEDVLEYGMSDLVHAYTVLDSAFRQRLDVVLDAGAHSAFAQAVASCATAAAGAPVR